MGTTKIKFIADKDYDKKLVKEFLRRKCEVSSTLLRQLKLIDNGITRNGEHVRAVDVLNVGDEIVITLTIGENEIGLLPIFGYYLFFKSKMRCCKYFCQMML